MLRQRTLKSLTRAVGLGVHGGHRVELTLKPAPADSGIVFTRTDLPEPVRIPVSVHTVCDTRMATTISPDGRPEGPKVQTIEHLLSAIAGLGLDNVAIDISGEEVPILDGSAASFVYLLQSAGIVLQDAPKRFLRVRRPVEVREGEGAALKWARLEPFHGYRLSFEIDFNHPALDATAQRVSFDFGPGGYKRDIARARTFGFSRDVDAMRARGLGLGGSMDNVIVVDDSRVLNADGLRYDDEFAKHKLHRVQGRARAEQPVAAAAAGRPRRVRRGELRRRGGGARRLRRSGARMVSRVGRAGDAPAPHRQAGRPAVRSGDGR